MILENLLNVIEKCLPESTAMENDRLGLQIQSGRNIVKNILITIEVNDQVIQEAVNLHSDCIITFHPLIFFPFVSIKDSDRVGRLSSELIRNNIALIAIHTNFDSFIHGTSKILSNRLGLTYDGFLVPNINLSGFGMGVIAKPEYPLEPQELLNRVSNICYSPLRYCTGKENKLIEKISIVGGAGSNFLTDALKCNSDAMITADVSYHTFHRALGKIILIDPGHYEMEQFVPQGLTNFIIEKIGEELDSVRCSTTHTNPVHYFPNDEYYLKLQVNNLNMNLT